MYEMMYGLDLETSVRSAIWTHRIESEDLGDLIIINTTLQPLYVDFASIEVETPQVQWFDRGFVEFFVRSQCAASCAAS